MKTKILTILLSSFGICFLSSAQVCVEIDFEQVPNTIIAEGIDIKDQYFEDFGVSFILDNNEAPVVAQVGSPAIGFGSAFGDDAPAPGADVGNFFLTDDGQLSGLESIGLLITFDKPLQSAEGCIIDIDFGERFIMEARDINNEIILADTITSGEPNTGDGILSCWSIDAGNCFGIASFRIKGFRETPGFFGYGYDNFVFCLQESSIAEFIDINSIDPACSSNNGVIAVSTSNTDDYVFSIDGVNFKTDSVFTNLGPGIYEVTVQNLLGCIYVEDVLLESSIPTISVQTTPITCNGDDATIQGTGEGGNPPYAFSLDGINYQDNNVFENLSTAIYTVYIQDAAGCINSTLVDIQPNTPLGLNAIVNPTTCGEENGSIEISAFGGASFQYSINGIDFQMENSFPDLPSGPYLLTIMDDYACTATEFITIDPSDSITIESIDLTPASCEELNGSILITGSGGKGTLTYALNKSGFLPTSEFNNLPAGFYSIQIMDEDGCTVTDGVELEGSPKLRLDNVSQLSTDCGEANGMLTLEPSGGTGRIRAILNNNIPQPYYVFENLTIGDYQILLFDELGCELDTLLKIRQNECPIYIPNVFSPNGDGANDYFKVYPHPDFQGKFISLKIFDRWGEFVFEKQAYNPEVDRWDGTFKGEPFNPGVYVFLVELIYENGRHGLIEGDVTIIK